MRYKSSLMTDCGLYLNGLVDQVEALLVGANVGRKATLISHIAGVLREQHTHGLA